MTKQTMMKAVTLSVLICVQSGFSQSETASDNINYRWAFVARSGENGNQKIGTVTQDTTLHSGDELKLYVCLEQQAYIYIIYRGPKDELRILFPYSLEMFDKDYKTQKNYYVPAGKTWLKLDEETGLETFYVIASTERLSKLEKALKRFAEASVDSNSEAAVSVLREIKEIKNRFRNYSSPAERPIPIAGNVRGPDNVPFDVQRLDIARLAWHISADSFYSRTIAIDHR